jgi:similar to stage IV sporulation protein
MISYIRGNVTVQVRGRRLEEFLNTCSVKKIVTWDVRYRGSKLELTLHLSDFFRLRPLLKQTGCRAHVKTRQGLPFFLVRLERRKFFAAGLLLFVLGMYLLSSIVWSVHITGNGKIPKDEVLEAARKHGIHSLQWKPKLDDPAQLSRELLAELPGATWIGVEVKGTQVQIEIVEAVEPDRQELLNPRHLVSTSDAVVTEIFAERGKPVVEPNTAVKKGQILISGIIGDL